MSVSQWHDLAPDDGYRQEDDLPEDEVFGLDGGDTAYLWTYNRRLGRLLRFDGHGGCLEASAGWPLPADESELLGRIPGLSPEQHKHVSGFGE
jgi:hypothetical protein